ncbi:MAG: tetratricopeptide repeat protein [Firmicutes bacterium]|nr:tetratricopeptide repeat protein [Bacillota bacterium]MCM1402152.1 tetratricopeptide repeat protein [Bacteroides sp.]MCM1478048.1 tetratricopeptide repeat protein [Bacteroides sp.]
MIKKFVTAIIYLFTAFALPAQINTDQVLQIGRNALYFEDYVLSIQYFNQVIGAKPYLAQPYFYRALAKLNLEDYQGAETDATLAIDRNPFITDAYELRGVARQNLGKDSLAIEDYAQALSLMPGNRGILYNMALAQEATKDYDNAEKSFETLLENHPGFDGGYLGRAKMRLEKKDTVSALEDINKALSINKNAVNGYLMRADISIHRNQDYTQALADMDEAIKLQPRVAGYFINRAFIRYRLDDYFGAMSDYDYALQLDPANFVAVYNRALLRMEVHDYNKAIDDLTQVLALRPQEYRALYNRAMLYREIGDMKNALTDISHVIDVIPNFALAYYLLYDIKHTMGMKGAQADLDKSIALARKQKAREGLSNLIDPGKILDRATPAEDTYDENSQDAVMQQFSTLLTVNDNADIDGEYNNKGIRGKVQDQSLSIELEPMFTVTYYTSPTELKPTGDYLREIDDVNNTRALRYLLQLTNHEHNLTDADEINKHFQSIEYYNSYLATHTPRAIDFFGRAMDQMTVKNYAAAIADLDKAIAAAPDFTVAYLVRSVARNRLSEAPVDKSDKSLPRESSLRARKQQVIADLDSVIHLSPRMAIAYFNKGVALAEMKDFTSALNAFNQAIKIKPDFGEAYYNRGYSYFQLGNRAAGAADLSRAGELGIVPSYNLLKRMSR